MGGERENVACGGEIKFERDIKNTYKKKNALLGE